MEDGTIELIQIITLVQANIMLLLQERIVYLRFNSLTGGGTQWSDEMDCVLDGRRQLIISPQAMTISPYCRLPYAEAVRTAHWIVDY